MEKKATRRIIGILVVVALVIILLPLFNGGESQTNVQTAEMKAPPFPDTDSNDTPVPATEATVAQNTANAPSIRSWFQKVMSPQAAQSNAGPDKTEVTSQATIQPTISDEPNNAEANAGTITPPKQDTLIANSAADGEEDVEQGTMNNVTVKDTDATPVDKAPTLSANGTSGKSATQSSTPAKTIPMPIQSSAARTIPVPTQALPKPIATPASEINAQPSTTSNTIVKPANAPTTTSVMSKNAEPLSKTLDDVKRIAATAQQTTPPDMPEAGKMKVMETAKNTVVPSVKVVEQKKVVQTAKATPVATTPAALTAEQLKKAAWVVQMGSFKSKINAEKLTNALRSKGFKAFTYATRSNGQTRVYVGPEFKQSAALTVASKVQTDMKMHGIVVPFKPLEL